MRQVDIVADQTGEQVPQLYQMLATAASIREARLQAYSCTEESVLLLFHVNGRRGVENDIAELPPVLSIDVTSAANGKFTLFVEIDIESQLGELFRKIGMEKKGMLVLPVLLRDEKMHARWVAEGDEIADVFADTPTEISRGVVRITEFWADHFSLLSTLTDRQREVLRTAVEMGHYAIPSQATHADIATALGCSTPTVTEHLRKAEGRILRQLFSTADTESGIA